MKQMTKEDFLFEKQRLLNLRPREVVDNQMDRNAFSDEEYLPKANTLTKLQLLLEFGDCLGQKDFFGYDDDSLEDLAEIYLIEYFTDISVYNINKALLWVNEHIDELELNRMSKWLTATRKIANLIHTKKWNKKAEQQLYSYFMVRTSWAFDDYKLEKDFESKDHYLSIFLELKPKNT